MGTLSGLNNVLMFITNKCNLKCEYCYVCQGADVMSFDIAKKILDNIDDFTVVDFFGGEALLEIDLLEKIVDYAKEQNRHFVFQLYSNGTRFDERVRALLNKGVNIGVSFDGISSFDRTHNDELTQLILNNVKAIKKIRPGFGVKTAITPDNVDHIVDNVKFIYGEGINFISHFLLRENVWTPESIKLYEVRINELMEWYSENIKNVKLDHFDGFLMGGKRKTGCWAGCEGVAINFNGDLYPCQRFLTNGSPFVIGNIDTGITNKMFQRYDIRKFVGCPGCDTYDKCNNICIASQWENGAVFKPIPCVCELTRISYQAVEKLRPHYDFIYERAMSKMDTRDRFIRSHNH
jgi:uncharacterized protein